MDGGGEVLESGTALLAAGLDHRQHRFYEAAAAGALRAEGELAPDDGVTQRAFACVVRRLQAFPFCSLVGVSSALTCTCRCSS